MRPLQIALAEYDTSSFQGKETNPDVLKYFSETGFSFIHDDETPWCAAFLNWVLQKAGYSFLMKLNARSFLTFGTETKNPTLGDIVVLWRISPTAWQGHVGLFIKETNNLVYILGGNQDGEVSIKAFSKTQLLEYRKLPELPQKQP